jgi:hypothetical protein
MVGNLSGPRFCNSHFWVHSTSSACGSKSNAPSPPEFIWSCLVMFSIDHPGSSPAWPTPIFVPCLHRQRVRAIHSGMHQMHALVGLSRARIEGSPQGMPWSYRWLVFFPYPFPWFAFGILLLVSRGTSRLNQAVEKDFRGAEEYCQYVRRAHRRLGTRKIWR